MLDELFSWLHSSDKSFSFSDLILTSEYLESEHKIALATRQKLIADIRIAHISKASPAIVSELEARNTQNDALINFIEFFAGKLAEAKSSSLFLILLNYLLSKCIDEKSRVFYEEKINVIFSVLLKESKVVALDFYHANPSKFANFSKINLMIGAEKITVHLAQLKAQLIAQESPLSIVPLFMPFIDDTEKMAAVILWLLEKEASVETIMRTNLLQNIMLYHAAYLDEENDVRYLYRLLGEFPAAASLIERAGKVQCEDRRFYSKESAGDTNSYAITGKLCKQSTLVLVPIVEPTLDFTPTTENFESLYKLFGTPFLIKALEWAAVHKSGAFHTALHTCLNNDTFILTELPALINFLGAKGPSPTLKALSSLLDEATTEKLIARHNGAVLHLLSYKPTLAARISASEVNNYLKEMREKEESIWVNIPQLLAVLAAFKNSNPTLAALTYESVLDMIAQHPEVLDDSHVMEQLQNFHGAKDILTKRCEQLQSQFDSYVTAQISSVALTTECYHGIEDTWVNVSRSLDILNQITPVISHCPSDKYKLQAYLAKLYFALPSNPFVLDEFAHALEIAPDLLASEVTAYERLLIEVLATVDNEALRRLIIGKFESNDAKKDVWMQQEYGETDVFDRAVQQGNTGLIQWLETKIALEQHDINRAVMMAAECQQWNTVNYFCSGASHKPHRHVLRDLLNLAAKAGQLKSVQILCESAITHLDEKVVEPALILAAVNNHKGIVEYLCTLEERPPCTAVIAKALKRAIQFNCLEVIDFIGNLPENRELLSVIVGAMIEAITNDDLPMVQRLCGFHTNKLEQPTIEKAFNKAIHFGNLPIAQFLFGLLDSAHKPEILGKALKIATKNEHLPTIAYLNALVSPRARVESGVAGGAASSPSIASPDRTPSPHEVAVSPTHEESPLDLIIPPHQVVLLQRGESMGYVEVHHPMASPSVARGIGKSASCSTLSALVRGGFFSAGARREHSVGFADATRVIPSGSTPVT